MATAAQPASAQALRALWTSYSSVDEYGTPLYMNADAFADFLEECPDLLTDTFTLDDALDVFDGVTEETDPGLSLKQFIMALSDIAEERYPDVDFGIAYAKLLASHVFRIRSRAFASAASLPLSQSYSKPIEATPRTLSIGSSTSLGVEGFHMSGASREDGARPSVPSPPQLQLSARGLGPAPGRLSPLRPPSAISSVSSAAGPLPSARRRPWQEPLGQLALRTLVRGQDRKVRHAALSDSLRVWQAHCASARASEALARESERAAAAEAAAALAQSQLAQSGIYSSSSSGEYVYAYNQQQYQQQQEYQQGAGEGYGDVGHADAGVGSDSPLGHHAGWEHGLGGEGAALGGADVFSQEAMSTYRFTGAGGGGGGPSSGGGNAFSTPLRVSTSGLDLPVASSGMGGAPGSVAAGASPASGVTGGARPPRPKMESVGSQTAPALADGSAGKAAGSTSGAPASATAAALTGEEHDGAPAHVGWGGGWLGWLLRQAIGFALMWAALASARHAVLHHPDSVLATVRGVAAWRDGEGPSRIAPLRPLVRAWLPHIGVDAHTRCLAIGDRLFDVCEGAVHEHGHLGQQHRHHEAPAREGALNASSEAVEAPRIADGGAHAASAPPAAPAPARAPEPASSASEPEPVDDWGFGLGSEEDERAALVSATAPPSAPASSESAPDAEPLPSSSPDVIEQPQSEPVVSRTADDDAFSGSVGEAERASSEPESPHAGGGALEPAEAAEVAAGDILVNQPAGSESELPSAPHPGDEVPASSQAQAQQAQALTSDPAAASEPSPAAGAAPLGGEDLESFGVDAFGGLEDVAF